MITRAYSLAQALPDELVERPRVGDSEALLGGYPRDAAFAQIYVFRAPMPVVASAVFLVALAAIASERIQFMVTLDEVQSFDHSSRLVEVSSSEPVATEDLEGDK